MAPEVSSEAKGVFAQGRHEPGLRHCRSDEKDIGFDAAAARRFLEILNAPKSGCNELRVLRAAFDRQGRVCRGADTGGGFGGTTLAGWFDDNERLIKEAHRLNEVSGYVTFNPVRSDLVARADNRLTRARHTTRDVDILCLRWLYLDIDAVRPAEISSTEAELAAAIQRRDAILGDHPGIAASSRLGIVGKWRLGSRPAAGLPQRPAPCRSVGQSPFGLRPEVQR